MIEIVRSMAQVGLRADLPSLSPAGRSSRDSQQLAVLPLQTLRLTLEVQLGSSSSSASPGAFLAEFGAADIHTAWASAFSFLTILPLVTTSGALSSSCAIEHPRVSPPHGTSPPGPFSFFVYDSPAQHEVVVPSISGPICVRGVESAVQNKSKHQVLVYTYAFDFTIPNLPVGPYGVAFRLFFTGPSLGLSPSHPLDTAPRFQMPSTSSNLQLLGTVFLPVEVGCVLLCSARSFAVQPHRVIVEVDVQNTSNRAITIEGVQFDMKSTWIGQCKGSLENVPNLPEQKVAPKAIDIPGVELLEECVVLSPLNVNDTTPLLQSFEQYSFLFSISIKPHLVHLTKNRSLADELGRHVMQDSSQRSGNGGKNNSNSNLAATSSGQQPSIAGTAECDGAAGGKEAAEKTKRIKELLGETFVSSIYVQHSAMCRDANRPTGSLTVASPELEKETAVVWSFRSGEVAGGSEKPTMV
jgi:hypothetical protein